jgi:hypothetical protein
MEVKYGSIIFVKNRIIIKNNLTLQSQIKWFSKKKEKKNI